MCLLWEKPLPERETVYIIVDRWMDGWMGGQRVRDKYRGNDYDEENKRMYCWTRMHARTRLVNKNNCAIK